MKEIQHTDAVLKGLTPRYRRQTAIINRNIVAVFVGLVALGIGAYVYRKYLHYCMHVFVGLSENVIVYLIFIEFEDPKDEFDDIFGFCIKFN